MNPETYGIRELVAAYFDWRADFWRRRDDFREYYERRFTALESCLGITISLHRAADLGDDYEVLREYVLRVLEENVDRAFLFELAGRDAVLRMDDPNYRAAFIDSIDRCTRFNPFLLQYYVTQGMQLALRTLKQADRSNWDPFFSSAIQMEGLESPFVVDTRRRFEDEINKDGHERVRQSQRIFESVLLTLWPETTHRTATWEELVAEGHPEKKPVFDIDDLF